MGLFDAIANTALGVQNGIISVWDSERNRAQQRDSQRGQNEWQSEENDKDRLWQQQEWLRQFQAQNEESWKRFYAENDEWQRRFNAQNEYNDPSAVIARLRAAGINPAAAMGQLTGAGGLAAAGGSSSPDVPQAAGTQQIPTHGVTPVGLQNPAPINISGLMSGLAEIMNASTNAKRLGLDTDRQNTLLPAELRQKLAQAGKDEAIAAYTNFQKQVDEVTKIKNIEAHTREMLSREKANIAQAFALYEQGKTEESKRMFNEAMAAFTNSKDKALQEYIPFLTRHISAMIGNLHASTEELGTRSDLNKYQSDKTLAEIMTIDGLRNGQIKGQQLANTISEAKATIANLDAKAFTATQRERIEALVVSYGREGWLTEEQKQKAFKAIKDNNFYEVEHIFGLAESASRTAKNVTSSLSISHWLLGD